MGNVSCRSHGYWLLVTGYWLLVTGYWLLVTGYWLLVTGYWLLVTGYWLLVTGYWLLVTGYWLLVTGYWLLVTGDKLRKLILKFLFSRANNHFVYVYISWLLDRIGNSPCDRISINSYSR